MPVEEAPKKSTASWLEDEGDGLKACTVRPLRKGNYEGHSLVDLRLRLMEVIFLKGYQQNHSFYVWEILKKKKF